MINAEKLQSLENNLMRLISESNNPEMMDAFLEWQLERNRLNENFLEWINRISDKIEKL